MSALYPEQQSVSGYLELIDGEIVVGNTFYADVKDSRVTCLGIYDSELENGKYVAYSVGNIIHLRNILVQSDLFVKCAGDVKYFASREGIIYYFTTDNRLYDVNPISNKSIHTEYGKVKDLDIHLNVTLDDDTVFWREDDIWMMHDGGRKRAERSEWWEGRVFHLNADIETKSDIIIPIRRQGEWDIYLADGSVMDLYRGTYTNNVQIASRVDELGNIEFAKMYLDEGATASYISNAYPASMH